jgi:Leucine-rich repeat (LRR) protein
MQEPQNESKPQRTIKPGRWVFRAAVAMFFIAVWILGIRAYRFNAAVNAVSQYGGHTFGFGPQWLEDLKWDWENTMLYFSDRIGVNLANSGINDHDIQQLVPHLKRFDNLKFMFLGNTHISDDGVFHLTELEQLSEIDLDHSSVSDKCLEHLSRLPNLDTLGLDYCNITDEGIRHLQNLKRLESLSLDGTDVTDEGLKHLKSLKNLKELSVSNTGVTDEGCAELLKAIPGLEILDD